MDYKEEDLKTICHKCKHAHWHKNGYVTHCDFPNISMTECFAYPVFAGMRGVCELFEDCENCQNSAFEQAADKLTIERKKARI